MKNNKNLLAVLLTMSMLVGCDGKTNLSSGEKSSSDVTTPSPSDSSVSEKVAVALDAVQNLNVVRDGENLVVTFDAVNHASSYKIKVTRGDETIVAEKAVTSGDSLAVFAAAGDYAVAVKAIGDGVDYVDSEYASFNYNVTIWENHVDDNGHSWNARVEQGVVVGEAQVTYSWGDTYVGTYNADYTRKYGRYTYSNNMYYEGEFTNDKFEGQGLFSWSTTGKLEEGNNYRGTFVDGSSHGQVGTYTWVNAYTNAAGMHYWTGVMEGMCWPRDNELGNGKINFGGQYYVGDVLHVSGDNFQRVGQGENIWTSVENCGWFSGYTNTTADVLNTKEFDRYVGGFDTVNHAWFYGNGVMYIKNPDGTPYGYVVGNWDWAAGTLTEWKEFNPETDLMEAYRAEGVLNLTKSF